MKPLLQQVNTFELSDPIIPEDRRIHIPNWNRTPRPPALITLKGLPVSTRGATTFFAAMAGSGKSRFCEIICTVWLNPDIDGLGFRVMLTNTRPKILYVDTEMSLDEHDDAWCRMMTRAGLKKPKIDKRVVWMNLRAQTPEERKETILKTLRDNPEIGLVLIDGAGDMVEDTNSAIDAARFTTWLACFNPNIGVLVTIHLNPEKDNDRNQKLRGHIGSELIRRASYGLVLRQTAIPGVFAITNAFTHGKGRNAARVNAYYKFSNEEDTFVTEEELAGRPIRSADQHKVMLKVIFKDKDALMSSEITKAIMKYRDIKERAAKTIQAQLVKQKILELGEDTLYRVVLQ